MKHKFRNEYFKRAKLILKSKLNGRNKIKILRISPNTDTFYAVQNMLELPILRYISVFSDAVAIDNFKEVGILLATNIKTFFY